MTAVYRTFDGRGRLLYVGVAERPFERIGQHRDDGWAHHVATISLCNYATRREALDAEADAIRNEDPVWNINGRPHERFMQWMAAYPSRDPDAIDPETLLAPAGGGAR